MNKIFTNIYEPGDEYLDNIGPTKFKPTHILYHADCMDGVTAAALLYGFFKHTAATALGLTNLYLIPVRYNAPLPDMVKGDVIFVDFAPSVAELTNLARQHNSVTVFDHHYTSTRPLVEYAKTYDDDRDDECPFKVFVTHEGTPQVFSGAGLVRYFLHDALRSDEALFNQVFTRDFSKFIDLAQRHDLWEHTGALSDPALQLNYWFSFMNERSKERSKVPFGPSGLWHHASQIETDVLVDIGRMALEEKLTVIRANIERTGEYTKFMDHLTFVCQSPHAQASLTGQLIQELKQVPFSITYDPVDHRRIEYSLRSRSTSDFDVSALAKAQGGGGHRNAAGFVAEVCPDEYPAFSTPEPYEIEYRKVT